MKWTLLVTWAACFGRHSLAQQYDYGIDTSLFAKRQSSSSRIVVGKLPLAADGSIPIRPEIRDMKKNKYAWDLYILSLSMFQYIGQDNPLSFYQVAGIHGVPFETWNGVEPVEGASQSGYCTHSSVLFPMWHRPYVALYEQQLYKLANGIAGLFPDPNERVLYQQAAATFRVPYWDWSIMAPEGQTHLPEPLWSPLIAQYGPNGIQNIKNPLHSYVFHPLDVAELIWDPINKWNETKRYPDMSISKTAPPSKNEQASSALLAKLPELQQRLHTLFGQYHDYNSFSNKAWATSQNLSYMESIESVHDVIHVVSGGKGHMTYVPLSSFDPLFFLHHAMTDRLISMWQVLNPNAWVAPMAAGETTYTALKGTIETSSTPLTPFFASTDGTFWTSDTARTTETFGYVYEDVGAHAKFNEEKRQILTHKVNAWYGGSNPIGIRAKARQSVSSKSVRKPWSRKAVKPRYRAELKLSLDSPAVDSALSEGQYREWIANVQVNVEALDGSFTVHFFLDEPATDGRRWYADPNHVGSVPIFIMNRNTGSLSKVSGTLPLTVTLMKLVSSGDIASLSRREVVPFLRQHLRPIVLNRQEKQIPLEKVEGLQIDISSANVIIPANDTEFPIWGRSTHELQMWR